VLIRRAAIVVVVCLLAGCGSDAPVGKRLETPSTSPETVASGGGAVTETPVDGDSATAGQVCELISGASSELGLNTAVAGASECRWTGDQVVLHVDEIADTHSGLEVFQQTGDPVDAPSVGGFPAVTLRMENGTDQLGVFGSNWQFVIEGAASATSHDLIDLGRAIVAKLN
jgi:hypothetical protein